MTSERISRIAIFTTLCFEVLFIIVIGSFILRGYFSAGQLPAPYHPDPADFGVHHTISLWWIILAPWIILVGVAFSVLAAIKKQLGYTQLTVLWILSILILIWLSVDPLQLSEWILD